MRTLAQLRLQLWVCDERRPLELLRPPTAPLRHAPLLRRLAQPGREPLARARDGARAAALRLRVPRRLGDQVARARDDRGSGAQHPPQGGAWAPQCHQSPQPHTTKWRVRATTAAAARSIRLKVVHVLSPQCHHGPQPQPRTSHTPHATRHAPRATPMVRPRGHLAHPLCTHQPSASGRWCWRGCSVRRRTYVAHDAASWLSHCRHAFGMAFWPHRCPSGHSPQLKAHASCAPCVHPGGAPAVAVGARRERRGAQSAVHARGAGLRAAR